MTEDEFMNLFDSKDVKEVTDVFAAITAEKPEKPKKYGVNFSHNEQNADGHTLSVYAINLGGKTVAWAIADNDLIEMDEALLAQLGEIPPFVTPHRIRIENAQRTDGYISKGIALSYQHGDKTHIGTSTVRVYAIPRIACIMGHLYGV